MKAIAKMKSDTGQRDETWVAVQSWLWVQVELVWYQIPLRPTFYKYFKGFVGGIYMYVEKRCKME